MIQDIINIQSIRIYCFYTRNITGRFFHILNLTITPIRFIVVSTSAVSYQILLYTSTLAVEVPKSFSMNVATPAPMAKIAKRISVVLKENRTFVIDFNCRPLKVLEILILYYCNMNLTCRN